MNSNMELSLSDILGTQRTINEAQTRLNAKLAEFVERNAGAKVGEVVGGRTAYSGKDAFAEIVRISARIDHDCKRITITYTCKTVKQPKGSQSGVRSGIDATVYEHFQMGELNKEVA